MAETTVHEEYEEGYEPPAPGDHRGGSSSGKVIAAVIMVVCVFGLAAVMILAQGDEDERPATAGTGLEVRTSDRARPPGANTRPTGSEAVAERSEVMAMQREMQGLMRENLELRAALEEAAADRGRAEALDQRLASPLSLYRDRAGRSDESAGELGERADRAEQLASVINDRLAAVGGDAGNAGRDRDGDGGAGGVESRLTARPARASAAYAGEVEHAIRSGTMIRGVLETALDSVLPGTTRAIVTRPVYSHDGERILIPASSRLVGEYAASSNPGDARIFISWQRIIRPDGVTVEIAAPGTDQLGRPGAAGDVDTRFWQRFGGALLLSVVDEAAQLAADEEDTSVRVFGGAGQTTSRTALSAAANIPPRIRVPHGTLINVMVRDDLVFSGV